MEGGVRLYQVNFWTTVCGSRPLALGQKWMFIVQHKGEKKEREKVHKWIHKGEEREERKKERQKLLNISGRRNRRRLL